MAVVAVLLIHIESTVVTPPKASITRPELVPTHGSRQRGEGNPAIDAVHEHAFGQHEAADEDEDHRIGERARTHRGPAPPAG